MYLSDWTIKIEGGSYSISDVIKIEIQEVTNCCKLKICAN